MKIHLTSLMAALTQLVHRLWPTNNPFDFKTIQTRGRFTKQSNDSCHGEALLNKQTDKLGELN